MSISIRIHRYAHTAGPAARFALVALVGLGLASCTSASSSSSPSSNDGGTSGNDGGTTSGTLAIKSFTASTDWVLAGTAVTLSWDVTGATKITLDGNEVVGKSMTVSPTITTSYMLSAWQGTNPLAVAASVTVYAGPPLTTSDLGLVYKTGGPAYVTEEGTPNGEYFTAQVTVPHDTGLVGMTAFQSHAYTTWSCAQGGMAGNKISFPDGCAVQDRNEKACIATVTPFVLRAFGIKDSSKAGILWPTYSFTWSGTGCSFAGQTEHMDSAMAMAPTI